MATLRVLSIVLASVLGLSKCAYVDTLKKCKLYDEDCQKLLTKDIIKGLSKSGLPELGISPIDPVVINELNITIPNFIEMKLSNVTVKGVRNCDVEKFNFDMEKLHTTTELKCDINIKSIYKMKSLSSAFRSLFNDDFHGEGNGKVKIEQMIINIDFPFEIQTRGSDTFLTSNLEKYKYSFHIDKKVEFYADKIYLGKKESSKEIMAVMNSSWKAIVDAYGTHFFDVATKIISEFLQKFFDNVATRHYIENDLTPYMH